MSERSALLGAFLAALRAALHPGRLGAESAASIDRVFSALRTAEPASTDSPIRLPVCEHLPAALDTAGTGASDLTALLAAFEALEPSLRWRTRQGGPTASANFAEGHANAMIVGPSGMEPRDDVWVGVSLLAPDVRYPDHDHGPEEVYLVLSPGEFRQGEGDWFAPGIGGTFYNVPNIRHAMRSGPQPLFAIWCLWADKAA